MFHVFAHAEFKNGIGDDSYESQFQALVQLWKRARKRGISEKEKRDAELEALSYFTGDGWLWKEKHAWKRIIDAEWLLLKDVVEWLENLSVQSDHLKVSLDVYRALEPQPLSYRDIMYKRINAFTDFWKKFWHVYFTLIQKNGPIKNRYDWLRELNDDDWKGSPFSSGDTNGYAYYKDGQVSYEYVKEQFDIIVNPHSDEQLQKIFKEAFPRNRRDIQKVDCTSFIPKSEELSEEKSEEWPYEPNNEIHIDTIKTKWETMAVKEGYIPSYIIDTDIGDDIDDAFALSIALDLHLKKHIKVQYIITSGHGHSEQRARLIDKLCTAKDIHDIPIVRGMTGSDEKSKGHYMARGDGDKTFPSLEENVSKIQQTVSENYNTTVICIGPLDNIQLLDLPPERVNVVLMGGCFERFFDGAAGHIAEYNVKHGILAWQWALRKYKDALVVPLDTAGRGRVPWGDFKTTDTPSAHVLRDMYNAWYANHRASHPGKLPPNLTDGEGCDISLDRGTNSNIQFDSVALFLSLQLDQCVLRHGCVVVDAEGKTSMAEDGFHRVAMDWKEGGLTAFQTWFQTHISI